MSVDVWRFVLCCVCITASTRKVYEKKLQQLLEQPPVETTIPEAVTIIADGNQNGNTHSAEDQYSDKEEGRIALKQAVCVCTDNYHIFLKTSRARVKVARGRNHILERQITLNCIIAFTNIVEYLY